MIHKIPAPPYKSKKCSEKAEPVLSEIKKLVDDFDYITASEKLGIFIKENGADI